MARNKITFEREWDDVGRATYKFTGSQRQPTLSEIEEFIENERPSEIEDEFMVCAVKGRSEGGAQCWDLGGYEPSKTIEFWGYNGGSGDGTCPICGHERDMSGSKCPVCLRPWE